MFKKIFLLYVFFIINLGSTRQTDVFIKISSKSTIWKEEAFKYMGNEFKPHNSCQKISYDKRYSSIRMRKYYLAINLHNNQEIIPQMFGNIIELISYISPKNLFLSIFESGSNDQTKVIIQRFTDIIEKLGIKYQIFTSPLGKTDQMNRIEYLAFVRNLALEPLYKDIEVLSSNSKFTETQVNYDAVLFLNDVYYCANDILELFYQQALNDAHMVAGMDYDAPNGLPMFYDTWVAHLLSGHNARKEFMDRISDDEETNERIEQLLPVQLGCVWNGVAVMSIEPFKKGIRFRRGNNVHPNEKESGECAGSECSTLCLDFIKHGFSKIMMVPRVKVILTYIGRIRGMDLQSVKRQPKPIYNEISTKSRKKSKRR